MKKALTVLAIAAVVLGGFGFIATSQSASAQEATTDTVRPLGPIDGVLDQLVDDGTINADQAQAIRDALVAEAPFGPRGFRGHGGPGLDVVAGTLGMTTDELLAALQDGQTIAEIAGEQLPEVTAALQAQAEERIDQALADGRIDAGQAADAKANAAERIDAMVNGDLPCGDGPHADGFGGRMRGGHMGGGFGPGGGGFGPGAGTGTNA